MRLDKVLAHMGYGSRKDIKRIMKQGIVQVDGNVVRSPAMHIDPHRQSLRVGDHHVHYKEHVYFMLNKPAGVITATYDLSHSTVLDLLSEHDRIFEPFPVGRLDKDTEGLLFLTNDGKWAHRLLSPKKKVPKCYEVTLSESLTASDIERLETGIVLEDGYETLPARVEKSEPIDNQPSVRITIHEGKYHQVKRMFKMVGKDVLYLRRISVGNVQLDTGLKPGDYRELEPQEMEKLEP